MEAGHRCALPNCGQTTVHIAHIEPWAKVKNHEFHNLIALCPTCHARFDRGEIDLKAMRAHKAILAKGADFSDGIAERVDRLEALAKVPNGTAVPGFAEGISVFYNRTFEVGFVDGKRFMAVGTCTLVRPRVAIVPGKVLDMIDEILQVRGDHAAVFEPSGMTCFRQIVAISDYGDLRLIQLDTPKESYLDKALAEYSGEEQRAMEQILSVNESRLRCALGIRIGELIGFLTPVPSALNRSGAPLFRPDGTLVGLVTDIEFTEAEIGGRPVFTTLLSLHELWKDSLPKAASSKEA